MSAFDATIRVADIQHELQRESEGGPAYQSQMVLGILTLAQIGPQQFLPIPIGALRVPLDKDSVGTLIKDLQEVYEQLETRPNIAIANSLEGVDQAAKFQQGLTDAGR